MTDQRNKGENDDGKFGNFYQEKILEGIWENKQLTESVKNLTGEKNEMEKKIQELNRQLFMYENNNPSNNNNIKVVYS
jgi:hypothetical protein